MPGFYILLAFQFWLRKVLFLSNEQLRLTFPYRLLSKINGELTMAKIEGWEPHPTRKIIYKDLKTGLLYRRRESGSFDMVPLKMTEHQVLEIFRKADGIDQKTN